MSRKCHVCSRIGRVESMTVRVYMRRTQRDFRFEPCADCRMVLMTFLEGSALAVNRSFFDHQHWGNAPLKAETTA